MLLLLFFRVQFRAYIKVSGYACHSHTMNAFVSAQFEIVQCNLNCTFSFTLQLRMSADNDGIGSSNTIINKDNDVTLAFRYRSLFHFVNVVWCCCGCCYFVIVFGNDKHLSNSVEQFFCFAVCLRTGARARKFSIVSQPLTHK